MVLARHSPVIGPDTTEGALLITGVPGSGKTTVSQLVAERLPRAARLDGDVFGSMLVSGHANMLDADGRWNPGPEGIQQLRLRMANVCTVANNFADAGFTPVIDLVLETRSELTLVVRRLRVRPVLLVVLCPPLDVARHRNATRSPETRTDYDVAPLAHNQRRELGALGWWLDTGRLTPARTADLIVAKAAQRASVHLSELTDAPGSRVPK